MEKIFDVDFEGEELIIKECEIVVENETYWVYKLGDTFASCPKNHCHLSNNRKRALQNTLRIYERLIGFNKEKIEQCKQWMERDIRRAMTLRRELEK